MIPLMFANPSGGWVELDHVNDPGVTTVFDCGEWKVLGTVPDGIWMIRWKLVITSAELGARLAILEQPMTALGGGQSRNVQFFDSQEQGFTVVNGPAVIYAQQSAMQPDVDMSVGLYCWGARLDMDHYTAKAIPPIWPSVFTNERITVVGRILPGATLDLPAPSFPTALLTPNYSRWIPTGYCVTYTRWTALGVGDTLTVSRVLNGGQPILVGTIDPAVVPIGITQTPVALGPGSGSPTPPAIIRVKNNGGAHIVDVGVTYYR